MSETIDPTVGIQTGSPQVRFEGENSMSVNPPLGQISGGTQLTRLMAVQAHAKADTAAEIKKSGSRQRQNTGVALAIGRSAHHRPCQAAAVSAPCVFSNPTDLTIRISNEIRVQSRAQGDFVLPPSTH